MSDLHKALAAFQAELTGVQVDAENSHFHNKYPTFAAVRHAIQKPMERHGLMFWHGCKVDSEGHATLECTICHAESGAYELSVWPIEPAADNDPQKFKACVTYLRRTSLAAMLGLAEEDDDGNEASDGPKKTERAGDKYRNAKHGSGDPNKPASEAQVGFAREVWLSWQGHAGGQQNMPAIADVIVACFADEDARPDSVGGMNMKQMSVYIAWLIVQRDETERIAKEVGAGEDDIPY